MLLQIQNSDNNLSFYLNSTNIKLLMNETASMSRGGFGMSNKINLKCQASRYKISTYRMFLNLYPVSELMRHYYHFK